MCPRNRRASPRRSADRGAAVPPQRWAPELRAEDEYEDVFWISETTSYVIRWGADRYGRVVEFAVIQRLHSAGAIRRVAVYDACHFKGVHLHLYDCDGNEIDQHPLRPVRSYEELEDGMDYATERVVVDWQENERRSRRGHTGAASRGARPWPGPAGPQA